MEEKVFNMLNVLAAKLNTTVEHLWGVLVNQAPIEGISSLIAIGIGFIIGACALRFAFKRIDNADFISGDKESIFCITGFIIGGICLVASTITFLSVFLNIMGAFFNPEYWALERLGQLFSKLQ